MQKPFDLTPELSHYIQEHLNVPDVLTHPHEHFMQIPPEEAMLLQFLIRSIDAKNILEIGTLYGFSAAAMAIALPEGGKVITCDQDERTIGFTANYWAKLGVDKKIKLLIGDALMTLEGLVFNKQYFDFIFIDADKKNYIPYLEYAKKLISKKGIIAIDNTLYSGEVISKTPSNAARAVIDFNQHLKEDQSVYSYLLPIADGLTLIQLK